ncbi:hypothetical protein FACS18945_0680 [Bacteroidia bacterium]|nr:hypothetical protein FACS18945_0680 [Bacteroidia bacterium]
MEEFVNTLDTARFESTNGLWNELMLNNPWSVGYVSTLIETREFQNKEDWESYYYQSGEERSEKNNALPINIQIKLNDEQLVRVDRSSINSLSWDYKNLNYNQGRTREQIANKGRILYQEALQRGIDITEEECVEAVRFRTICQTWNGIIIRERRTIKILQERFPNVTFKKTDGNFDYEYAVDYQLFKNDVLICGIQIKPSSYNNSRAPYVLNAKAANRRKNSNYSITFDVPVFNVFFERGAILNQDVISLIQARL